MGKLGTRDSGRKQNALGWKASVPFKTSKLAEDVTEERDFDVIHRDYKR